MLRFDIKFRLAICQGFLDEQFVQLEELQDDANPNFVEEIVTLYYRDSSRLILSIEQALYASYFLLLLTKFWPKKVSLLYN